MKLCESCGMPLTSKDVLGTNHDLTPSLMYCKFCFREGKFLDAGITLEEKIQKNIFIAVKRFNMPLDEAEKLARETLPKLKRWKQ